MSNRKAQLEQELKELISLQVRCHWGRGDAAGLTVRVAPASLHGLPLLCWCAQEAEGDFIEEEEEEEQEGAGEAQRGAAVAPVAAAKSAVA